MGQHRRRSQKQSDLGSFLPRQHSRGLALAIVCLLLLGGSYTIWVLARPLYWRLYAEVIHKYQLDPAFVTSNGVLDSGRHWHGSSGLQLARSPPSKHTAGNIELARTRCRAESRVSTPRILKSATIFCLSGSSSTPSMHNRRTGTKLSTCIPLQRRPEAWGLTCAMSPAASTESA